MSEDCPYRTLSRRGAPATTRLQTGAWRLKYFRAGERLAEATTNDDWEGRR
jgi:YD repeat-containing protein